LIWLKRQSFVLEIAVRFDTARLEYDTLRLQHCLRYFTVTIHLQYTLRYVTDVYVYNTVRQITLHYATLWLQYAFNAIQYATYVTSRYGYNTLAIQYDTLRYVTLRLQYACNTIRYVTAAIRLPIYNAIRRVTVTISLPYIRCCYNMFTIFKVLLCFTASRCFKLVKE